MFIEVKKEDPGRQRYLLKEERGVASKNWAWHEGIPCWQGANLCLFKVKRKRLLLRQNSAFVKREVKNVISFSRKKTDSEMPPLI